MPDFKNARMIFLLVFLRLASSGAVPVSAQTPASVPAPAAASGPLAGRAENIPGQKANTFGVYPVRIRWQKPVPGTGGLPLGYHIYRSSRSDAEFRRITAEPIPAEPGSGAFYTFIDENPHARPGEIWFYRVLSLNDQGQGEHFTESVPGYGALSPEQYLREYIKTVKSSIKKLTLMNKPSAISKLGSESRTGSISGSLSYRARIAGLGARIIMIYNNYADFYISGEPSPGPYFIFSGEMNTSASMDQSGRMDGVVTIDGMYPGKVYHDKLLIKHAAAAGGTYGVEPRGFPRTEVSWTLGW